MNQLPENQEDRVTIVSSDSLSTMVELFKSFGEYFQFDKGDVHEE